MPDYSKNIIYTIKSKDSIYVGSTVNFTSRKNQHKNSIYNENNNYKYNLKLYKTIRGNNGDWDMQPYSKYPCNDIVEQKLEEQRIRCELKADLNMISCGTGLNHSVLGVKEYKKQYYTDNKEKKIEYYNQYRTDNKDKLAEQQKQKVTCECGCISTRGNLPRHRKSLKHLKLMENK
jgi:hypothetical protein